MKRLARLIDGGLAILDQERMVRTSGLFDADWYARTYPDAGGPQGALEHYLGQGAAKGHDPGPAFSTSAYLAANPDVREAGCNPLFHYLRFGREEGRGFRAASDAEARPLGPAAMVRIAEAFDRDFYAATNPDLPAGTAMLDHFLGQGCLERRDPCPWFSIEYYLASHPDVAATGQNSFIHYLLRGCHEGRAIRNSHRRRLASAPEAAAGRPHLAALSMVRNEADIIRAFAGHLLALFDEIVIVDHMSDDGTAEFLAALARENRRVTCLTLDEPAYIQSVAMTHAVRDLPVLREADWVFILDADEFLPFADRDAFETALGRYAACPVIEMRWRNLVPQKYWQGEVALGADITVLEPPVLSPFRKIAFQPARISLARTVVAQGNHALVETLNGLEIPAFAADFPILHLPVRSADQLVLKLNQGVEAYRRLGRSRDSAHGTHWDQMIRATAARDLSGDLMNAVAERYSEDKPDLAPISSDALLDAGHRLTRLDLANAGTGLAGLPRRPLGELLMRLHASPGPDSIVRDCPAATQLETCADGQLRRRADDPGEEYAPLAPDSLPVTSEPQTAPELLARMMARSYLDIEDLVPSSKAGHIPFLFALTEMLRPRRYVELGTLRGAAFLAVCQSARQCGFTTEAVAVSSWSVDEELRDEYRNVFETFTFLARKYADMAGYLRKDHAEAAVRFGPGSIDLLLLDGFRGADHLTAVLGTWLPRLSDRGVLVLHDTNAHGGAFGVWQVWEDLAARYPSLEFPHAEGLGVACVGKAAPPDLVALCRQAGQDRHLRVLLRQHFEQMGRLSTELFARRYDMARSEARARAEGAQAEELSWLRQELDSLRMDNDQLRALLKRNIANAVAG